MEYKGKKYRLAEYTDEVLPCKGCAFEDDDSSCADWGWHRCEALDSQYQVVTEGIIVEAN
jgi:hypothetical protein